MPSRPFWFILTWACILWYALMVLYFGWKGFWEIRGMIADLKEKNRQAS